MNLLLVRHGEISSNVKKIYAGRSSEELNERGAVQAREVAEKIYSHNINFLYSSPVRRAVQTAEIIGNIIGKEYIIEENFREIEMGPWEGLSEKDIARRYANEWQIWKSRPAELKLPGRETLAELLKRVLRGFKKICKSNNTEIAVVTHVAIIRVLLLWDAGKSLNHYKTIHVPNAKVFRIRVDDCMKQKLENTV